jgi:hypothetical protein
MGFSLCVSISVSCCAVHKFQAREGEHWDPASQLTTYSILFYGLYLGYISRLNTYPFAGYHS